MRFTPSADWISIANGSNRAVTWTVSIKKTTTLNAALSAGTWVDATSFIVDMPEISQQIEYELGQFSSDSISFTARNIDWWEANIFNATASEYLELKITATIARGSTVTSDVFYAFSGFIDKVGVVYNELADTVSFDVFTADELGGRISALNVKTQYVNNDCDGAGTDGLILPLLPGIFVVNAAVSSYNLKVGLHSIDFIYDTLQIRLDDGAYSTLSGSDQDLTLANLAGDEKITLHIEYNDLQATTEPVLEYVIVSTAGTTLPDQPYYGQDMRSTLNKLYAQIGIDSVTYDTLTLATNDSSNKFSFFDSPPSDGTVTGRISSVVNDGTNMYFGIGDTVYKRTMSTFAYSTVTTKTSYVVKRLWYESNGNNLWIWFSGASNYVRVYHLGSATSDEVDVGTSTYYTAADLMNITGAFKLIYLQSSAGVKEISTSAVISSVFTNAGLGYSVNGVTLNHLFTDDYDVYFTVTNDAGDNTCIHKIDFVTGWADDGLVVSGQSFRTLAPFPAALHKTENRLYYVAAQAGGLPSTVQSILLDGTNTIDGIGTLGGLVSNMLYANSVVYAIANTLVEGTSILYSFASHAATIVTASNVPVTGPANASTTDLYPYCLTYFGSKLYGIDNNRMLWQYSSTINMFLNRVVWTDTSVKSAITNILQAYNLVGTISAHKKAFVYRRGNDSGTIQTTGNSISLTTSNTSNIARVENSFTKILWVEVTSGETTYSYDGTTYNAGILSDSRTLSLSNNLIPESIVQDIAKYLFTFYNTAHDKYSFDVDVARMEYEVMDGAAVVFTTTKITKSATGLITAQTLKNDGSQTIEVIF